MIRLENVSVQYGGKRALEGVSTTFAPGEFTCIVGPNGSGKSTLLKAITGIIPSTGGSIFLNDIPLRKLTNLERAQLVAYLPQSRPVPELPVLSLIQHGRFPHLGFSKTLSPRDRQQVEYAIDLTDTGSLLERSLTTLSGGERQRVYLAMAIAQDARILLLDEPSSHLDLHYQLEFLQLLQMLQQLGKTILMVSQDLPQAFTYADTICVMQAGIIRSHASPNEVLENGCLPDVFGYSLLPASEQQKSLYRYLISGAEYQYNPH